MNELPENQRKGRVVTVFVVVNLLLLALLVGLSVGVHATVTDGIVASGAWYNDGPDSDSAYISGQNVYDYDRIAIMKFDLGAVIGTGHTINSIDLDMYCNYATATTALRVHASPAYSGSGFINSHAFSNSEIDTYCPSTSYAFTVSSFTETYWGGASGMSSTWQTQYESNGILYIGISGWGYGEDARSYGFKMTDANIHVTYDVSAPVWAPHFDSSGITTADLNVEYDYEVIINETSDFEIINMPSWLSCEDNNTDITSTHLIGTPTAVGTYAVHLHATSVEGTETAQQSFNIEVTDPNAVVSDTIYPTNIIWKDGGEYAGYISGSDDPWAYGRFIFMKFDLSSIPTDREIYDVELNIQLASGGNYPIAVNATGAFSGNGSGYSFSEAQLASLSPAGSRAFQIDGTNGGHGMIATWQTQYENNRTIYIGLSAWDWSGTSTSDQIYTFFNDGTERTPRIVVTYSAGEPAPTWAPDITSTPDTTGTEGVYWSYQVTANETVSWDINDYPAWMTWAAGNATLYGTPSTAGSYDVSIQATSTAGTLSTWQNFTVVISVPPVTTWAPTITSDAAIAHGWLGVPYTYQATANESVTWSVTSTYGESTTDWVYLDTSADIAGNAGIVKHGGATYWECANWFNRGAYYLTDSGTNANAQFAFDDLYGYLGTITSIGGVWVYAEAYVYTNGGWEWTQQSKYYALNPTTGTEWTEASVNSISGYYKSSAFWGYQLNGIYVNATQVTPFVNQGYANGLRGMYLAVEVAHDTPINIASVTTGGVVSLFPPAAGTYTINLVANSDAGTLDAYYNWTVTVREPWAPTLENTPDATGIVDTYYQFYYQYNESINAIFVEADWNGAGTWDYSIGYGIDIGGSYIGFTPDHGGVYTIHAMAWSVDGLLASNDTWDVTVPVAWNPTVTSHPSQLAYVGFAWSYTWVTNETCTLVTASIPAWVAYNAGTHTWSGTPLTNGTTAFSATFVSVVEYGTVTQYWNVTVLFPPTPVITSTPATTAYADDKYKYAVSANTASFTVTLLQKPSWGTLSVKTVGGTAHEGKFTFEVFVYDTYWHTNTTQTWTVTVYPESASDMSTTLGGGMWAFVIPLILLFVIAIMCCVTREGISGASFLGALVAGTVVLSWGGAFGPDYLAYVALAGVVLALMIFRAYREV